MTHYEALGVAPDAPAEEIRRAYLRLARRHHPDLHAGDTGSQDRAELRMRDINAAWAVLGDPARRAEYDRGAAGSADAGSAAAGPAGPAVHQPSTEFHPLHEGDDEDDAWRYEPDEYDPRTAVGRFLGAGPPLLLLVGVLLLAVSLVVGLRPLAALAIMFLLLAGALFVGAPLVAVFRSQINEQRTEARRGRDGR